ncbi:uncharacterized protein [Montipora foliosa]|uniref:uncharacterized protein n=1 Tax=Montipora foliosa TaxID=591990 RepID=UPI0035F14BAF
MNSKRHKNTAEEKKKMSSSKLCLFFFIFGLLLTIYCQHTEGQLLGIRWGRNYYDPDVTREEYKGNLWESMKRRFSQQDENDMTQADRDIGRATTSQALEYE